MAGGLRHLGHTGDIAGHLGGRRGLLFHRRVNGAGDRAKLIDSAVDIADAVDRLTGRRLHFLDLGADAFGRGGGLPGQIFHLRGDHRETLSGVAGAGRLNRRVERQQIGLLGDIVDQTDDGADLLGRLGQGGDPIGAFAGDGDGGVPLRGRALNLGRNLVNRLYQRLGRGGQGRGLVDRRRRRRR